MQLSNHHTQIILVEASSLFLFFFLFLLGSAYAGKYSYEKSGVCEYGKGCWQGRKRLTIPEMLTNLLFLGIVLLFFSPKDVILVHTLRKSEVHCCNR